jgi:hypothetical protein
MAHNGGTAEEGRAAARDAWPQIDHARYGAAEVGSEAYARRQQDRIGAILGGFAVVLLMVGLAQVGEMGLHRSGAMGRGSRLSAAMTSSLGRRQPARKQGALASLQDVATPNAPDGEGATAAPGTNEIAPPAAAAAAENSSSECCRCEQAAAGTAGQEAQSNTTAAETPAGSSAASGNVSVEPAAVDAEPEVVQVTAAARGRPLLQNGRKLLQDDSNVTAAASVTDGNGTAPQDNSTDPEVAGAAGSCCPCPTANVKVRQVEVEEDWSREAMPRNAWDDALSLLTYIGKEAWGGGYGDVHKVDGDRLVPKPIMPEHQTPWIGPRDIMVPALEFQGTMHNSGWTIPPSVFGDGHPRVPKEMTAVQKDVNSYASDVMEDQRITHMNDPANVRGRQLPSVFVDWSRIPHPAEASKQGDLIVSVCRFPAQPLTDPFTSMR